MTAIGRKQPCPTSWFARMAQEKPARLSRVVKTEHPSNARKKRYWLRQHVWSRHHDWAVTVSCHFCRHRSFRVIENMKDRKEIHSALKLMIKARFQVLTATKTKSLSSELLCSVSLLEIHRSFRGACCVHLSLALLMPPSTPMARPTFKLDRLCEI
jgi:hypothetical protein